MTTDKPAPTSSGRTRSRYVKLLLAFSAGALIAGVAGAVVMHKRKPAPVTGVDCDGREECGRQCDAKDWGACTRLAGLYWFPKSGARDIAKAESLYRSACDAGEPSGCFALGRMYQDALALHDKSASAPELLRQAAAGYERKCNEAIPQACLDLAAMHVAGRGVDRNQDKASSLQSKAAPLLEKECNAGTARACASLSLLSWGGSGVPKDVKKSYTLAERACELGDKRTCIRIAADYITGRPEAPKDPAHAAKLYGKACDMGDLAGCHTMAMMYHDGTGVPLDPKKAADFEKKACDVEFAAGCRELGRMFGMGDGVKRDVGRQDELYKREVSLRARACSEGNAEDCGELAHNYRSGGFGVPIDPARAKDFDEQAIDPDVPVDGAG